MNKVADALYCLTRADGGLVMILDSRVGVSVLQVRNIYCLLRLA